MKAKQDKSTRRNRADGNRAVMRGPSLSEVEEVIGDWLIDPDHGVTYNDGAYAELLNRLRPLFEDPA
jgi:hypothetical protein